MQEWLTGSPLNGQVAFVTGGGAGIGRASALALAGAGAAVVIADIVPERCEEAAAAIREAGRTAMPLPVDVADGEALRAAIGRADREFGRIDVLVNNAGGTGRKDLLDQSERSWRRVIDLNLVSLFTATQEAARIMVREGRGGSIVNVSSIEGSRAAPRFAAYAACKAGMNNFTRTMALELADHAIRVNAIAPDYTPTPGLRGNIGGPVDPDRFMPYPPGHADATARRIPLGRGGKEEECGAAVLFLASPMSSYITGVTLPVDGGSWASSGWVRDRSGAWNLAELHEDKP